MDLNASQAQIMLWWPVRGITKSSENKLCPTSCDTKPGGEGDKLAGKNIFQS